MENITKTDIILSLIILIGIFILGWIGCLAYQDYVQYKYPKAYNGLWIPKDNLTKLGAIETAKEYDNYGNWICINIRDISIEQMLYTCEHEVGHEIFAQKCMGNVTKCLEAVK